MMMMTMMTTTAAALTMMLIMLMKTQMQTRSGRQQPDHTNLRKRYQHTGVAQIRHQLQLSREYTNALTLLRNQANISPRR
jgi:hypothetical protein